jgi:hypothetical protein
MRNLALLLHGRPKGSLLNRVLFRRSATTVKRRNLASLLSFLPLSFYSIELCHSFVLSSPLVVIVVFPLLPLLQ